MSKTSPKRRYTQLMSWLETYGPSQKSKQSKRRNKSSRNNQYAKKGR